MKINVKKHISIIIIVSTEFLALGGYPVAEGSPRNSRTFTTLRTESPDHSTSSHSLDSLTPPTLRNDTAEHSEEDPTQEEQHDSIDFDTLAKIANHAETLESSEDWSLVSEDEIPNDSESLIEINRDIPGQFSFRKFEEGGQFHSAYEGILELNDYSYAVAKEFYRQRQAEAAQRNNQTKEREAAEQKVLVNRERSEMIRERLLSEHWTLPESIMGFSGGKNVTQDLPCVISFNQNANAIVIAFHGSLSGNKKGFLPKSLMDAPDGDWGANYDYQHISGDTLGFSEVPANVQFHSGFGWNVASVLSNENNEKTSDRLYKILEEYIAKYQLEQESKTNNPPWVIVTGHSKGAAMASIAGALIKGFLSKKHPKINLGEILFSAPRAFHGKDSRRWVHNTVGIRNILRINVHGDPVPLLPTKTGHDFYGVGALIYDNVGSIIVRANQYYLSQGVQGIPHPQGSSESWKFSDYLPWKLPETITRGVGAWKDYFSSWQNANSYTALHYGSNLRGNLVENGKKRPNGFEFDPHLVIRATELREAFKRGLEKKQGSPTMYMPTPQLNPVAGPSGISQEPVTLPHPENQSLGEQDVSLECPGRAPSPSSPVRTRAPSPVGTATTSSEDLLKLCRQGGTVKQRSQAFHGKSL